MIFILYKYYIYIIHFISNNDYTINCINNTNAVKSKEV